MKSTDSAEVTLFIVLNTVSLQLFVLLELHSSAQLPDGQKHKQEWSTQRLYNRALCRQIGHPQSASIPQTQE